MNWNRYYHYISNIPITALIIHNTADTEDSIFLLISKIQETIQIAPFTVPKNKY